MAPERAARLERALCAALLLALSVRATAAAPIEIVDVRNPRPVGHTIGDVLERVVTVDAGAGYALVSSRLPGAGRIDALLEARAPVIDTAARLGGTRYTIRFAYQIMGSPETVTTLLLPAVTLAFERGAARHDETFPDWAVTAAPLAPAQVLGRAGLDEMLPDAAPPAIGTRPLVLRLGLYAAAAALMLFYLAYRRYGLAWPQRPGPFARAYRDIKVLAGRQDEATYPMMLRRLHRAFDESAGRSVFAGELADFFARRPGFAPIRPQIEQFFAASRAEFFGAARAGRVDAVALCRECRRRERGGR
ncbi:MAG: hypothetical protein ACJ8NR_05660 [Sulfurifustis sp.]